jgi:surface carbohydrate biosynthesis protein (TIGR04326 family)
VSGGYPQARISEVEALRFLHLRVPVRRDNNTCASGLRILVCADFLAATNQRMLSWLKIAASELPWDTEYLVKPHPAFPVDQEVYPFTNFKIAHDPIYRLLQWCDVMFSSSTTSAGLDAFCAYVPVVQMMDGHTFNTSPLRGRPGIVYVESSKALASALKGAKVFKGRRPMLFNLGKDLRNWRDILRVEE